MRELIRPIEQTLCVGNIAANFVKAGASKGREEMRKRLKAIFGDPATNTPASSQEDKVKRNSTKNVDIAGNLLSIGITGALITTNQEGTETEIPRMRTMLKRRLSLEQSTLIPYMNISWP
jgi:hypothetical protein